MIYTIDFGVMTDEDLQVHDRMMVECTLRIETITPLAIQVWAAVLQELERRGKVKLVSGSFDDLGNAHIVRL